MTSHNRKVKTLHCLELLFRQNRINTDYKINVFLVDDGCTDGTSDSILKIFPQVQIIKGDGNLYWNRGMHLAWQTAICFGEFNFYLWLNDDTFLLENAIEQLLKAARNTSLKSVICGSIYSIESQMISYGGYDLKGQLKNPNGFLQEILTFNGNVVLIPKFVFSKVGNLDKKFPHAIGDFDYALRIREANLKSYILENFIGTCEKNTKLPKWCSSNVSFMKRLSNLYSPLGYSHPYYFFIYELKHFGLLLSLKHLFSIHLRLIFPNFWIK